MRVVRHPKPNCSAPVALTIGNFDGIHKGHEAMIEQVVRRARASSLVACVMTFEPHPREFFAPDKAPSRLTSLREKLERIAELGVDQAVVCRFDFAFAQIAPTRFVERIVLESLRARYVLVGDDFRFGARRQGDFALLAEVAAARGVDVECMPSVSARGIRVSSTAVREALAVGDLDAAADFLGRSYSMSGRVVQGDRVGRKLGFPTANIALEHNRPPLLGIFAVEVDGLGGAPVRGAASLGYRPTVKAAGAAPVLEVHLFDFDRDVYGERVRVRFLCKLRDEEKYADLELLKAAIARDVANARAYFDRTPCGGHADPVRGAVANDTKVR